MRDSTGAGAEDERNDQVSESDGGETTGETNLPSASALALAPFEAWSEWLGNAMGTMSATPGETVPRPAIPGISPGGVPRVPDGGTAGDPLMSAMVKLSDANPMSNIVPINWTEMSRALQTLGVKRTGRACSR